MYEQGMRMTCLNLSKDVTLPSWIKNFNIINCVTRVFLFLMRIDVIWVSVKRV